MIMKTKTPLNSLADLIPVLAVACLFASTPARAQITDIRDYHGKTIYCSRSGLRGFASSCGIISEYAYIFVGSVLSATQLSDSEKRLELRPQELFLGDAASSLTVTTSQAECLGDIQPADRWLFYLQRDDPSKQLVLAYGSPSQPIAEATESLAMLRRLWKMTNSGILIGYVQKTLQDNDQHGLKWTEHTSVSNHKIIAKRISDGAEYSAYSNTDGKYEFPQLPLGSYHVTANTTPGLWSEEGPAEVRPGSCTQIQFELSPDGQISGYVRPSDGRAFE